MEIAERGARLAEALRLREAGAYAESQAAIAALCDALPEDAELAYQHAWAHDVQGDESGAIPHYERALALGLADPERRGALLGLGSSLRCVGRFDEAAEVLGRAAAEYPDGREFEAFLALAQHNLGQHSWAVGLLLRLLADTSADPAIARYARALRSYADRPDETW